MVMVYNPLISIVVPTYNRKLTIVATIDSVLRQTHTHWELLIIDDGSTDGTEEVVSQFCRANQKIKFLKRSSERLKGANACRNIGIELARGEYVALLDSDDQWKPEHLIENIKLMLNNPDTSGIYGTAIIDNKKSSYLRQSRGKLTTETFLDFLLSPTGFAPTPSLFMKSSAIKSIPFDETLRRHQDWDFFIKFGENYGWQYSGLATIYVDRKSTNLNIDFNSCIVFYERHKHLVTNNRNAYIYLLYTLIKAYTLRANHETIAYYKNELSTFSSTIDVKYRLVAMFPKLASKILSIKTFLSK
jgi:glycosyltransferase involved in cell wall biosynthesis